MRKKHLLVLALVPLAAGCILTSGQFSIDFELLDQQITTADQVDWWPVDLNTLEDYNDHKDKLKDIADVAILAEFVNSAASAIQVQFYVARDLGTIADPEDAAQVRAGATPLWGPFELAGGASTRIDWDRSAGLVDDAGLQLVLDEIRGDAADGDFVLFIVGPVGGAAYDFSVRDGFIVVTMDAGV
jgi:hypothetical protein